MKKKLLSILLLLFVFALAACSAPAADPTAMPDDHDDGDGHHGPQGTVTLWHSYHTGGAEEEALTKILDNARAEYPELTIEVLQIPFDQIFNKWQTEVAAGEGPDMFVAPNDDLGNLARSGLVMDVTSMLEGRLDNVVATGKAGMMVDGKMYGVPESAKAVALYYNKQHVATAPATVQELITAVSEGHVLVQNQNAYHLFGWFPAFGGDILSADGMTACASGEEPFVEAMQFLSMLKNVGGMYESDGGIADTMFRSGEAAMIINGPWTLGDYRADLGDDLGVAPIPAGMAPAGALNGIDGFYLNPNSTNAEAAVELALFLTNKDSAQIYTDVAGHVPVRSDVTVSDERVAGFAEASNAGYPRPQSASFGNYWGPFGDMVTKVLEGVSTPEEGVAEACANFQTAISGN